MAAEALDGWMNSVVTLVLYNRLDGYDGERHLMPLRKSSVCDRRRSRHANAARFSSMNFKWCGM